MLDTIKDYLKPKTFGNLAYVCSIVHICYGVIITAVVIALKEGEPAKFTCYVPHESTLIYKTQVDKACYSRYQQKYNAPLQFYLFAILSAWSPVIVALTYSLCVRRKVDDVAKRELPEQQQNAASSYVFYLYFFHLANRSLFGILFTTLQHAVFFPTGFDFEFNCSLESTQLIRLKTPQKHSHLNETYVACENSSAPEKQMLWIIVSFFNTAFALIMVLEITRLCRRFRNCNYNRFIVVYLLREQYRRVEIELAPLRQNSQEREPRTADDREHPQECMVSVSATHLRHSQERESSSADEHSQECVDSVSAINFQKCTHLYKEKVKQLPRPFDVFYGPKTSLDDLYVDFVIHRERAPHVFPKKMPRRHEIYDVYTKVPSDSLLLKEVKDLFYPGKDTKGNSPKKILVVGRPGIGKTVFTEKIRGDWAGTVDEFYDGKITFLFKFRWFNQNKKDMILKDFLRCGTELSDEQFEKAYEYITEHPEKAILVFDGLDEFNGSSNCLEPLQPPNNHNSPMPWICLFIKLISGSFLPGATVVVTSRPTANEFYSRFSFDRTVEIMGFSRVQIEEYVQKLCDNNSRSSLKPKIWDNMKSNSDILNLCYIPVNCYIVSTILYECFKNEESDCGFVPNTLTELYQEAVNHFDKHHFRGSQDSSQTSADAIKNLQFLAFDEFQKGRLVFSSELFNEQGWEQMRKSGLLNKLSNPISQAGPQFCFIHLTIQEFLAAKHVVETFSSEDIKNFVTSNVENGKWHLVLQFIAGLLGKKKCYADCVSAFANCFNVENGILHLANNISLCIIKCLREVDDEDLIKQSAEETVMKNVVNLCYMVIHRPFSLLPSPLTLTLSEWDAVAFVCKHMKSLESVTLTFMNIDYGCTVDVTKLLEQRCIKKLEINSSKNSECINVKGAISALSKSSCKVEHEHNKLTELHLDLISNFRDAVSDILNFFKNGNARYLGKLCLQSCWVMPLLFSRKDEAIEMSRKVCEVLKSEHCPNLTYLDLSYNGMMSCVDVRVLCGQELFKLTQLYLGGCGLTDECIPPICEFLANERCNLTLLSLEYNRLSDEGLRMLSNDALMKKQCKLENLNISQCSFTDNGVQELWKVLQSGHCKLVYLNLAMNNLTDKCIPDLCKALQNKSKRIVLSLAYNGGVTDDGLRMLAGYSLPMARRSLNITKMLISDEQLRHIRNQIDKAWEECLSKFKETSHHESSLRHRRRERTDASNCNTHSLLRF